MTLRNRIAAASIAGMLAIATPFVAVHEGLSTVPYKDIGGVWTWCYGETQGAVPKHTLTHQECSFLLKAKLHIVGLAVWALVDTPMTHSRWAALTSFSYNLGINAFRTSTLRRKINEGDPKACDQMLRWTFVGRIDCKIPINQCMGIPNRRQKERKLCNS